MAELASRIMGCYGYQKPISPNIDAFAEDATLFENAVAQSSWTKPSIASIFTGLGTKAHGLMFWDDALPDQATTLAEILRAAGYHTAAFVSNPVIDNQFGFDQGFRDAIYMSEVQPGSWYHSSDQVNKKAFAWLEKEQGEQHPFFLYVHTMGPHIHYTPPREFRERFAGRVKPEVGSFAQLSALFERNSPVSETLVKDLVSLYDAEIAFDDHSFGVFLKELKRRRLYEDALIVFVSDHGEAFNEHGRMEHGGTAQALYQELLDIPLIIKFPSSDLTPKKRVPNLAQHIDILPTLLEFLNLAVPEHIEGRSLLLSPDQDSKQPQRAFSYFESQSRDQNVSSLIEGPWKLIREWRAETDNNRLELYNREQDPGEKINLVGKYPHVAKRLLSLMKAHDHAQALKPGKAEIDEELRERLKALGYVQ